MSAPTRRRDRAEAVAEDALKQARQFLAAGAPVGQCLADQLILPFALAGEGSFVTQSLTRHTTTNIDVVRRFLDVEITTVQMKRDVWRIIFAERA